jgi:hypothetical protein
MMNLEKRSWGEGGNELSNKPALKPKKKMGKETYETIVGEQRLTAYEIGFRAGYSAGKTAVAVEAALMESSSTNHICDCCDAEFFGTDEAAREMGWDLCGSAEFCFSHAGI